MKNMENNQVPQAPQMPQQPPQQPANPQQPHRYTSAELEQMDTLGKIAKLRACYDDVTASTPEVKRFVEAFGISNNIDWNATVARSMDGYMSPERRAVFNAALASITI